MEIKDDTNGIMQRCLTLLNTIASVMQHVMMQHVMMQQCRDAKLLNTCDAKSAHLVRIDDELEAEQIVHVREFRLARLGQLQLVQVLLS